MSMLATQLRTLEEWEERVLCVGVSSLRFGAQSIEGAEAPLNHPLERRFAVRHLGPSVELGE